MTMTNKLGLLVSVLTWISISACAGDGTGLDEFGNPLDGEMGTQPLGPSLSSIQTNIFTPVCTRCHAGASAPLGLSLEVDRSFNQLVDVASVEALDLVRVRPGEPDSSYLVMKIEGWSGIVGDRMPLGLAPLSAEEIAAIRGWIAGGALQN